MAEYTREELVEFLQSEARIAKQDFWADAGVSVKFKAAADMLERDANDARRYRFLRDISCNSFSLSLNEMSAPNYQTVQQSIDDDPKWYAGVPTETLQRMATKNADWQLQIYPDTPIGFYVHIGASLDDVIDAAMPKPPEES